MLVHFEDMAHQNLDRLLSQYRGSLACFSDDVQARSDPSLLASALMPCMLRGSLLAVPSRSLLKGTAQGSFHKKWPSPLSVCARVQSHFRSALFREECVCIDRAQQQWCWQGSWLRSP